MWANSNPRLLQSAQFQSEHRETGEQRGEESIEVHRDVRKQLLILRGCVCSL